MVRGMGRCSPCREEGIRWEHIENVLSLSRMTGVSMVWVEMEAGRGFWKTSLTMPETGDACCYWEGGFKAKAFLWLLLQGQGLFIEICHGDQQIGSLVQPELWHEFTIFSVKVQKEGLASELWVVSCSWIKPELYILRHLKGLSDWPLSGLPAMYP